MKNILSPAYTVHRCLPLNSPSTFEEIFRAAQVYRHQEPSYVFRLPNSYITHYGPVLHKFRFAPTLTSQMKESPFYLLKLYLSCIKKIGLNKVIKVDKRCLVVHNNYPFNYYHWVLEIAFRLYLVRDYLSDHLLVLPAVSKPFQREMLRLFGLSQKDILQIEPENLIQAKEVVVPSYLAEYGHYQPELLREFADWILSRLAKPAPAQPNRKRIYITRKKASYRNIVNEDRLMEVLKEKEFHIIQLEELTFEEQVEVFNQAQTIVAPHGAGLTNLIFCKPGTQVIEIFPEGYIHLCFYTLADAFKLQYYYLPAKDVQASSAVKPFQLDMEVNLKELENMISQLGPQIPDQTRSKDDF